MVAINVILLPECTGEGCGGDNEICTDSRVHHHNAESRAPVTRNHRGAPSPGRWMEQDPTQYINGANTYQFANSSPVGTVDAEGLRALPGVQKSVLVRKEDIGWAYENKRRWEDRRQGHQIHYR
jgi:RHS repeat-associated protein